ASAAAVEKQLTAKALFDKFRLKIIDKLDTFFRGHNQLVADAVGVAEELYYQEKTPAAFDEQTLQRRKDHLIRTYEGVNAEQQVTPQEAKKFVESYMNEMQKQIIMAR